MLVTTTDIIVWVVSAMLALGVGASRYSRWKMRDKLARDLAAMDAERREKMLNRLDPKLALEMRQQLMERFRILS